MVTWWLIYRICTFACTTAAIGTHKEEGGRIPVIKELLSYSFKKNLGITESRNVTTGWTPLIRAAYKGYLDVVKVLLEYDANIHATGKKGFTALIAASQVTHFIYLAL